MTDSTPTDRQLRVLEERVDQVEGVVVATLAWVGVALIVLGMLLPYLTFEYRDEDVTPSVLTFGFRSLTATQADGGRDGADVVFGVAFVGLAVVALLAVALSVLMARRALDTKTRWLVNTVAALLVVGVLGVWATVMLGLGRGSRNELVVHQGPVWLSVGAILFAVLAWSSTLQDWWLRRR